MYGSYVELVINIWIS